MNIPPAANSRVPSRYTAPFQLSLTPQQWVSYTHETLRPILQATHFGTSRPHDPEPFNNAGFIAISTSRDPQGSVQNMDPSSHPFIYNRPQLDLKWQEPLYNADFCPLTSRSPQAFAQAVDPSSHPVFDSQPMPDPDWPGPNSTFPLQDSLLPQASMHAAVNPSATYAYSDGGPTNSTTSSAEHVQVGGGQLPFTAQDGTAWSGPVTALAPATPSLASYPDPAASHPRPPALDTPLQDLGIVDPDTTSWHQTASCGCAWPPMQVLPDHAPGRRPHPLVRIDDCIEWVSPNVMKMTLWFNWSPNADAKAHEPWD
ncbi:hypothetical protein BJV78DRAFT_514141 [Lactifluus subvellereus]|nr:hypothetical protein BJV78DRAFT_514141 [Lactifluus subvellereus]